MELFVALQERRYAGVSSVAAPVRHEGDVVGAVSVAGPTVRLRAKL